eukprot:scaffold1487_cov143-Ochromonas_danica.AAC.3
MVQQQQAVLQSQVQSTQSRYLCIDGSYESFPNAFKIGFAMKGAGDVKVSKRPKAPKFEFIAWVHGKGPNAVKISQCCRPRGAAQSLLILPPSVRGNILVLLLLLYPV